jgi:hypothetical protein
MGELNNLLVTEGMAELNRFDWLVYSGTYPRAKELFTANLLEAHQQLLQSGRRHCARATRRDERA